MYLRGFKFGILYFLAICYGWGQGDANLLLQYNRGPDLDGFYHPWNFSMQTSLNRINTNRDYTVPLLGIGLGLQVQHHFSKSFGLNTGAHFTTYNYRYKLQDNNSTDQLEFLELPLSIRLYPGRRLFFEFGTAYHLFLKGKNSEIVDFENNSKRYPQGLFQNAFGLFLAIHYNLWKGVHLSLSYRRIHKNIDPTLTQSNSFRGLSLGLHYYLKNPLRRPTK